MADVEDHNELRDEMTRIRGAMPEASELTVRRLAELHVEERTRQEAVE